MRHLTNNRVRRYGHNAFPQYSNIIRLTYRGTQSHFLRLFFFFCCSLEQISDLNDAHRYLYLLARITFPYSGNTFKSSHPNARSCLLSFVAEEIESTARECLSVCVSVRFKILEVLADWRILFNCQFTALINSGDDGKRKRRRCCNDFTQTNRALQCERTSNFQATTRPAGEIAILNLLLH